MSMRLTRLLIPYSYHYNPDFVLVNGVMLETKGYWDSEDRRKIKAVMRDNPDLDLRMVFQAPFNKISKKSKTRMPNGVRSMASSGQVHTQSP